MKRFRKSLFVFWMVLASALPLAGFDVNEIIARMKELPNNAGARMYKKYIVGFSSREIAKQETAIANAESEYISLESELNSLVSISMIDKYAVEKLGMKKADDVMQYNHIEWTEFTVE